MTTESQKAFTVPKEVYEKAIAEYAKANESGSCPDHCVAMACEAVWQASEARIRSMLGSEEKASDIALANLNRKRERCGIKPINKDDMIKLDPSGWDEYFNDAKATLKAIVEGI